MAARATPLRTLILPANSNIEMQSSTNILQFVFGIQAHTSLIGRYAPEELRFCTKWRQEILWRYFCRLKYSGVEIVMKKSTEISGEWAQGRWDSLPFNEMQPSTNVLHYFEFKNSTNIPHVSTNHQTKTTSIWPSEISAHRGVVTHD